MNTNLDYGSAQINKCVSDMCAMTLNNESLLRQLLTIKEVSMDSVQRSVAYECLVHIHDKVEDTTSIILPKPSTKLETQVNSYNAHLLEVPFFSIASNIYTKLEQELASFEMPLTDCLERTISGDLKKLEEDWFLQVLVDNIELTPSNDASLPSQITAVLPSSNTSSVFKSSQVFYTDSEILPKDQAIIFENHPHGNLYIFQDVRVNTQKKQNSIEWSGADVLGGVIDNCEQIKRITIKETHEH